VLLLPPRPQVVRDRPSPRLWDDDTILILPEETQGGVISLGDGALFLVLNPVVGSWFPVVDTQVILATWEGRDIPKF